MSFFRRLILSRGHPRGNRSANIINELMLLDDLDIAIILSIGNGRLNHLKIQKIALLVSQLLGLETDAVAYNYGNFSETIMEKLVTGYLSDYIKKEGKFYVLKEKGLLAYRVLTDMLQRRDKKIILEVLELLRKLPNDYILLLTYHLFPEYTTESKIINYVKGIKSKIEKISSKLIKIEKKKADTVVIEVNV